MKRILSLILSALLLASAVACSEAPVEDEGNESVQSAPNIEDSAEETEELAVKEDENSAVQWWTFEEALKVSTEQWMIENIYKKLIERSR